MIDAPWRAAFLAGLLWRRLTRGPGARTAVVSFYMANIPETVVAAQGEAIRRFLPPDVDLLQLKTGFGHGSSIDLFVALTSYDVIALLDIDCIPISDAALPALIAAAAGGSLVGAAHRANHIANDAHIYVGPFLMAFSRDTFRRLGCPSFRETDRGDVAEELSYRAEERGIPIRFLWPSSCETTKWPLTDDCQFGRNTVYDKAFLHAFEVRMPEQQRAFVDTVMRVLDGAETSG